MYRPDTAAAEAEIHTVPAAASAADTIAAHSQIADRIDFGLACCAATVAADTTAVVHIHPPAARVGSVRVGSAVEAAERIVGRRRWAPVVRIGFAACRGHSVGLAVEDIG